MIGIDLSSGMPFSPWQAPQIAAFSSIDLPHRPPPNREQQRRRARSATFRAVSLNVVLAGTARRAWPPPSQRKGRPAPEARRPRRVAGDQSSVKAMIALPRLKSSWVLPPAPTTMYCLPPTV